MRLVSTLVSLVVLLGLSVVGFAAPVSVDFSVMDINSIDITTPGSYTLDGVTFMYDDFGSGVDKAQVDSSGIFGSTYGLLAFEFDAPVKALSIDFSLLGLTQPGDVSDGLFIMLENGEEDVSDTMTPASFIPYDPSDLTLGGDANGSFVYSGTAFDRVFMFFSIDAPYFSVSSVSYEPEAVPEPAGLAALVVGLVGVPGLRVLRRKQ